MTAITDIRLWTALVTPFRKDLEPDTEAFDALVKRQLAGGVQGLLLFGSTGEAATLSEGEKAGLLMRTKQLGPKAKLMVGTTHNDTRVAVAHSQFAQKLGADALLVAPPYYNKPSQAGIVAHYRAIHEATSLPIVLYNIPSRVSVEIGSAALREMAGWPRIAGLKEAAGNLVLAAQAFRAGLTVWSGDDPMILPYMSLGAVGGISVNSNLFPAPFVGMIDDFAAGKTQEARATALKFIDWYGTVFAEGNPTGIKAALSLRGWMGPHVRPPLSSMTAHNTTLMKEALKALDDSLKV